MSSKFNVQRSKAESDWLLTSRGEARGYILPEKLTELWFHTGTTCNLRCPFCLEGSKPGDNRINPITFDDAKPFIDEAMSMGVEQFSFTGGEPFVIPEFVRILDRALDHCPCLVLTNGTEPLLNRMEEVLPLLEKPHPLKFRVSIDYPDETKHEQGRGPGTFRQSLDALRRLHVYGFPVSIARQRAKDEDAEAIDRQFAPFLDEIGVPTDINIVSFPEFLTPGETPDVPEITENCMTTYHTEKSRSGFMCDYTKFVLKKDGEMRVYACTLVDDDADYDLGSTLSDAMKARIMMKHHRCFSCFAYGASCSERM
ncbi:MAG: radical SAM protein [Verrucomicrobia bacterium]|nr:radical SAM protein [Verrucomicrobiota bacterium]